VQSARETRRDGNEAAIACSQRYHEVRRNREDQGAEQASIRQTSQRSSGRVWRSCRATLECRERCAYCDRMSETKNFMRLSLVRFRCFVTDAQTQMQNILIINWI